MVGIVGKVGIVGILGMVGMHIKTPKRTSYYDKCSKCSWTII